MYVIIKLLKIKNKKMNISKYIALVFCVVMLPSITNAQEDISDLSQEVPEEIQREFERLEKRKETLEKYDVEGTTDVECFDYYKFQSVQVSVGADRDAYDAGETVHFAGDLINDNDYPVVDGNVFVRISRRNDDQMDGHYIVDEFVAQENVSLKSGERKTIEFDWNIPAKAVDSEYQADYFFSVGKKFNLGGLPFTNEVVVGSTKFYVSSTQMADLFFDRANATVNGIKYKQIGSWPEVDPGEKVTIKQPLFNGFGTTKEIEVTYDLYYWDSLNPEDLIETKTETVVIEESLMGERTGIDLEYIIPEMSESVYYLKMTAVSGSNKSIINIRIVSAIEHARLNYPAITKFPINKGNQFTLFSCFHNSSPTFSEGTVEVVLTDKKGHEIGKMSYNGIITSSMMADKVDITSGDDYDYVGLHAKIYNKNNELVDEYKTTYDCSAQPNLCKDDSDNTNSNIANDTEQEKRLIAIVGLVIVTIIVIIVIITMIKRKK